MQACLDVQRGAEQADQGADQGKGQGHAQYIAEGQDEGPGAIDIAAAQHHAGKDGHHRQNAGGESQCQTGGKQYQQGPPEGTTGCCLVGAGRAGAGPGQIQQPGFRRVAQTGVGAALVVHAQLSGGCLAEADIQLYREAVVVHLHIAEELVMDGLAIRQLDLADLVVAAEQLEAQLVAVQVVLGGNIELQLDALATGVHQTGAESLINREKLYRTADIAEQAGVAGGTARQWQLRQCAVAQQQQDDEEEA